MEGKTLYVVPQAVMDWVNAYNEWMQAVETYSSRISQIKQREEAFPHTFGEESAEAEYHHMNQAEQKLRSLAHPAFESIKNSQVEVRVAATA